MAYGFHPYDEEEAAPSGKSGTLGATPNTGGVVNEAPQAGNAYADALDGKSGYQGTQSGFLNFGAFANANSGVANREAQRVNNQVAGAAQTAKNDVYGVNDTFMKAANGQPVPGSGGAAGPIYSGPASSFQGASTGTTSLGGQRHNEQDQTEAQRAAELGIGMADDPQQQQAYRNALEQGANAKYTGPKALSDVAGYDKMGADTRDAQRQLGATGSEAGLAALTGGNYADAALLNSQGSKAFKQTRDNYGDLNKFQQQVEQNAGNYGQGQENAANASAAGYQAQLDQYDQQQSAATAKKAADDQAAADAKKNGPQSFDDMTKNDTDHTMTGDISGKRNTTANGVKIASGPAGGIMGQGTIGQGGDAWDAANQYMDQQGVTGDRNAYWQGFLNSLPQGMHDYVNGMVLGGNPGVDALGDKIAPANSTDDWSWFNQLFNAYITKHGKS